jgi:hypothetical protein
LRINCEYQDHLNERCREDGFAVQVGFRSEREDWIQMMVAAGFGICFIPEFWPIILGVLTRLVADPGSRPPSLAGVDRRPAFLAGGRRLRARSGGIGGRRRRRRWLEPSAAVKLRARWRLVPAAPPSPILRYAAQARRMKDWADAGEWPSSPWGPHPAPHTPSCRARPGGPENAVLLLR